jgi:transposase
MHITQYSEGVMAKYKHTEAESGQGMFLTVNLKEQLLPGTFEFMLNNLIGKGIDISKFDESYKNDQTGASAIPPRVLIKIIIYGYSKGIKSSRGIWELCRNNIIGKALAEDMEPHWTTIADFISKNGEAFKKIFEKILTYCAELGLIGGNTFAIDGCRLPSNASLGLTGTAKELEKRLKVYQRMAENHVAKHRRQDERGMNDEETERHYHERQKQLDRQIEKISGFLETMEKKTGKKEKETRSNVTDNESALIYDSKRYIQGYIGLAVADKKEQIIVSARAVGSANECQHFPQMLDSAAENMDEAGVKKKTSVKRIILADKGYFSEENLRFSEEHGLEAVIADQQYKNRLGKKRNKRYEAEDFKYRKKEDCYKCPNGKKLPFKRLVSIGGRRGRIYKAGLRDCRECPLNSKCLNNKTTTSKLKSGRQLFISEDNKVGKFISILRKKLNTQKYQDLYAHRIQIIEPVFSNITCCKRLDRFSLRGQKKVNGQWLLFCMVHNLGKCLKKYNMNNGFA